MWAWATEAERAVTRPTTSGRLGKGLGLFRRRRKPGPYPTFLSSRAQRETWVGMPSLIGTLRVVRPTRSRDSAPAVECPKPHARF